MIYTAQQQENYHKYLVDRRNLNRRLRVALRGKQKKLLNQHYELANTKSGQCFLGGVGRVFNKHQQKFGV